MDTSIITGKIFEEIVRAEKKFPGWPEDIVHGVAIVQEETGELGKACLNFYYGRAKTKRQVLKEAIHAGAMIYRFLINYEDYRPGEKEKDETKGSPDL